jgi:hypothetical protein
MHSFKTLSILAIAATGAYALPAPVEEGQLVERAWGDWQGQQHNNNNGRWGKPIATVYTTVTAESWTPAPIATATATAVIQAPAPSAPASWAAATGGWSKPSATPVASPQPAASSAPVADTGDWQSVVTKWRSKLGLPALEFDDTLVANDLKALQNANGNLVHELNSGSFAQVLAPGDANSFESCFVGGWLCETPHLAGLDGICGTATAGWDHSDGETGHADILVSTSYTKIGCANHKNVWGCDLR